MKALLLLAMLGASAAAAQELPPISGDMLNVAAVACVKIDDNGSVVGAYLVQPTGDAGRDRHVLAWVKKLHWDKAAPGEKLRNMWFPMPVSFGSATVPKMPATCLPKP